MHVVRITRVLRWMESMFSLTKELVTQLTEIITATLTPWTTSQLRRHSPFKVDAIETKAN